MNHLSFLHLPTGVVVNEASRIEFVRIGVAKADDFEEARNLSDPEGMVTYGAVGGYSAGPEHGAPR